MSPVRTRGGSWSALGPCGWVEGSAISTGCPQRMHTGSQYCRTCLRHALYLALERGLLLLAIFASHDAAECFNWVPFLAGGFALQPSGVGEWAAVFAGRGVVLGVVFPSSMADDVLAIATGFAAVSIERVHGFFRFLRFVRRWLVGRSRARAVARSRPPSVVGQVIFRPT